MKTTLISKPYRILSAFLALVLVMLALPLTVHADSGMRIDILSVKKNKTCTAALWFRVAGLSYSAYPYPGRLGTSSPYQQSLTLDLVPN